MPRRREIVANSSQTLLASFPRDFGRQLTPVSFLRRRQETRDIQTPRTPLLMYAMVSFPADIIAKLRNSEFPEKKNSDKIYYYSSLALSASVFVTSHKDFSHPCALLSPKRL